MLCKVAARCWNHRIINVLDALPKKPHAEARILLCRMPYAETQTACEALQEKFTNRYRSLAPKAVDRLADDWEQLVTFMAADLANRAHDLHARRERSPIIDPQCSNCP